MTAADSTGESRPVARGASGIDLIITRPARRAHRRDPSARVASGGGGSFFRGGGGFGGGGGGGGRPHGRRWRARIGVGPDPVNSLSGLLFTHSIAGLTSWTGVFGRSTPQTMFIDVKLDGIDGERLVASAHQGKIAVPSPRRRHRAEHDRTARSLEGRSVDGAATS